jgi:N-acetylmuramate 1-kinase
MAVSMIPPDGARAFLQSAGWGSADILPLAGDASFRRYFRVVDNDERAVLMDAPPQKGEEVRPYVDIAEYLTSIGLSAPRILARDIEQGLLLIEDFGSVRMRETVDADLSLEPAIYAGVTDVLAELHRHAPPAGLRTHGLETWLDEVALFTEWYCPELALDVDPAGFREAGREVLAPVDAERDHFVTMLRDYHAENIMLLDGREGIARFGLLDFQDAQLGHPAYDLVSMLQDARRDVTPSIEADMLRRYMGQAQPGGDFEAAYWALGGQRNTRILGVFVRLWRRDGKPHYRQFQQRIWGLLERDLLHPALGPVREWFDRNVPESARAAAWAEFA